MIPNTLTYPLADQELFRKGILYGRWKKKYGQKLIFKDMGKWVAKSKQIPSKCPHKIKRIYGFGELFAAIHYMNKRLGYEVTFEYWEKKWNSKSYRKAVEILGKEAADFICQSHPQPPDLFVVDREKRFFFVEVKLPGDQLNQKQVAFNGEIKRYLNKHNFQSRRAQHMRKGHWIELLRLKPE
jgi:hypothetical protein